ncbi:MAG: polyprenyl synthetase family protein [Flavobacteriales bacterium]
MNTIENYSQHIEKEILHFSFPENPSNLYDPLRYFMTLGGKRMRPMLTLMSANLFGKSIQESMSAAMTVELFHNFSLIHDDIMDAAPLRRAKQTVHEKWNTNIAILSGDVLFVKAYEQLSLHPAHLVPTLLRIFNKTAIEVCEGQQMDMDFETRDDVSSEEYIEMIRLKTSVLLGCALEMGAIIGETTEENRHQLYQFGEHFGIAFQIQDDLLDLYGNPEKVGKQVGGDVLANKKTLLSILAKQHANEDQKNRLLLLQTESDSERKISETKTIFGELQIQELCQQEMKHHYRLAMDALSRVSSPNPITELEQLAEFLFHREY